MLHQTAENTCMMLLCVGVLTSAVFFQVELYILVLITELVKALPWFK